MVHAASIRQLRMGHPNLAVSLPMILTLHVGAKGGSTITGTSVVGPQSAAAGAAAGEGLCCQPDLNRNRVLAGVQPPATLYPTRSAARSSSRAAVTTAGTPQHAMHSLLRPLLLQQQQQSLLLQLRCCALPFVGPSTLLSGLMQVGRSPAGSLSSAQGYHSCSVHSLPNDLIRS
jgi:hypothetical protein